jgi:hypothetical protein
VPSAVFYSKDGKAESLSATAGMTIKDVLRNNGIPANAVLCSTGGRIVAEKTTLGPDDYLEIRQVRHYDLDVTRRPATRVLPSPNPPVYSKSVLFDDSGSLEVQSEDMDEAHFTDYVEQIFAASITGNDLLVIDRPAVVGLSGGRDSVAFLKLLERCRDRIGTFPLTAVTVTGLRSLVPPATRCAKPQGPVRRVPLLRDARIRGGASVSPAGPAGLWTVDCGKQPLTIFIRENLCELSTRHAGRPRLQ